jgi:hypothetical protein
MIVHGLFELMARLARDGSPIVLVEQNVRRAIALVHRFRSIERSQVVAQRRSDPRGEPVRSHASAGPVSSVSRRASHAVSTSTASPWRSAGISSAP